MTSIAHRNDHLTDAQAAQTPSAALSQPDVQHRDAARVWAGWAADAVGQHLEGKIKELEPMGSIALVLLMFLGAVDNAVVPRRRLRV